MCGRFTIAEEAGAIGEAFGARVEPLQDVRLPRYNVAPTDEVPVVIAAPEGRRAGPMQWGLVPHWAESPKVGASMINARSESVLNRRAYRESFLSRRCLVPADGFYEWEARASGKQPYWIHRPGSGLFAMAGIWAMWRPRAGSRLASFSILTRAAPPPLGWLHDRVPVILPETVWDDWLARGTTPRVLDSILVETSPPELRLHPVSRAVNRAGYDEPDCIEEVELADEAARPDS
ncbi:MAG: SOS response-associated peptidase [Gemmatimonadetes bacterium]|nr:SOS response-associated peptidase [Gemmatimonadota bacterium]